MSKGNKHEESDENYSGLAKVSLEMEIKILGSKIEALHNSQQKKVKKLKDNIEWQNSALKLLNKNLSSLNEELSKSQRDLGGVGWLYKAFHMREVQDLKNLNKIIYDKIIDVRKRIESVKEKKKSFETNFSKIDKDIPQQDILEINKTNEKIERLKKELK